MGLFSCRSKCPVCFSFGLMYLNCNGCLRTCPSLAVSTFSQENLHLAETIRFVGFEPNASWLVVDLLDGIWFNIRNCEKCFGFFAERFFYGPTCEY